MYLYTVEKIISPNNSVEDIKLLNGLLSNAECVHTTLGKLFNVDKEENWRAKNSILYKRMIHHTCKYLVQSNIRIDMNRAKELGFVVEEVKEPIIKNNDTVKFIIDLATFRNDKQKNKRTVIKTVEERIDWITNKLSHNNECTVLECTEKNRIMNYMEHNENTKGKEMLQGYSYEITVRVNDTNAFNEIRYKGIGPSKAYGFGLVQLV